MGPGAGPFHAQCTSRRSDPSAFPNRSRNHPIMHMPKHSLVLLPGLALTGLVACEGHGTAVAATSLDTGYSPVLLFHPPVTPLPGPTLLLSLSFLSLALFAFFFSFLFVFFCFLFLLHIFLY